MRQEINISITETELVKLLTPVKGNVDLNLAQTAKVARDMATLTQTAASLEALVKKLTKEVEDLHNKMDKHVVAGKTIKDTVCIHLFTGCT